MKIGSLVYACDSGLGLLAKAFVDHGVVTHPLVVRHGRHATHDEWFPGAPQIGDLKSPEQRQMARRFCENCDVMLFFETPFLWELVPHCRGKKIPTILMPMYECEHARLPYQPDFFINPSELDQQYYPNHSVHIPVPVEVPWRQRTRAEVFVHNAGHGGLKGRNGTAELIEAMRHVKSGARLTLRAQEASRQYWAGEALRESGEVPGGLPSNIDVKIGTLPYEHLWADGGYGDVFVFPEKFNGLSLPLQEARAAGMLVMCGDRFPMHCWLPKQPLIPVAGYRKNRIGPPYNEFDEAMFDPKDIAAKIDQFFGTDITEYSRQGKEWADRMSWQALKPRYMETLEGLLR